MIIGVQSPPEFSDSAHFDFNTSFCLHKRGCRYFDVLSDKQAELAAANLLNDQSGRDWARVVQSEVCGAVFEEQRRFALTGGNSNSALTPWERENLPQRDTIFVPARVSDNRFNNPEYTKVLEGLTGWQKRAWLDGDWDIAAGQFFTTLRREVHVISSFDDTRAVEWFAAMDYGFTHYTVVLRRWKIGDWRFRI